MRGASIADPQAALQQRCRSFAKLENQPDSVVKQLIVVIFSRACAVTLSPLFARSFEEALDIPRFTL